MIDVGQHLSASLRPPALSFAQRVCGATAGKPFLIFSLCIPRVQVLLLSFSLLISSNLHPEPYSQLGHPEHTQTKGVCTHWCKCTHTQTHILSFLSHFSYLAVVSRSLPSLDEVHHSSPLAPVSSSRGSPDSQAGMLWHISTLLILSLQDQHPNEQFECWKHWVGRYSPTTANVVIQVWVGEEDVKRFVWSSTGTCKHKQSAIGKCILIPFFVLPHTSYLKETVSRIQYFCLFLIL